MNDLMAALCLVAVIEGLMYFLMADHKDALLQFLQDVQPKHLRVLGLVMIVLGALSLQWVRSTM